MALSVGVNEAPSGGQWDSTSIPVRLGVCWDKHQAARATLHPESASGLHGCHESTRPLRTRLPERQQMARANIYPGRDTQPIPFSAAHRFPCGGPRIPFPVARGSRFRSARGLFAWAGAAPRLRQSSVMVYLYASAWSQWEALSPKRVRYSSRWPVSRSSNTW